MTNQNSPPWHHKEMQLTSINNNIKLRQDVSAIASLMLLSMRTLKGLTLTDSLFYFSTTHETLA
jgi:hypothetical protein